MRKKDGHTEKIIDVFSYFMLLSLLLLVRDELLMERSLKKKVCRKKTVERSVKKDVCGKSMENEVCRKYKEVGIKKCKERSLYKEVCRKKKSMEKVCRRKSVEEFNQNHKLAPSSKCDRFLPCL